MELQNTNKNKGLRRIDSMNKNRTVLAQMQQLISRFHFEKLVNENKSDKNVRSFTTWNLFQVMLYAQIAQKKSLRDICMSLQSNVSNWYHLGLQSISRNNLSNSLMKRPAIVFEKTFNMMLSQLQNTKNQAIDKRFKFKNPLYAIDSTTISLCLSLYKWASFRTTKAGIKIHTSYDIKKQIPDFMVVTEARQSDHRGILPLPILEGAIYVLDRGYLCFKTLANISKNKAFFVTRTKTNTKYKTIEKMKVAGNGILIDCLISFNGVKSSDYPELVRLVRFKNPEDNKVYNYITNNLTLSASTIANIYKSRWDIELFFKWIKQNLKIKTFIGTSENAVFIQIWIAAISYLLTEYLRFISKTCFSRMETFRIISVNIFASRNLIDLLCTKFRSLKKKMNLLEVQLDFGF
jgi:hypothetical protein